jgi:hypothetical protein
MIGQPPYRGRRFVEELLKRLPGFGVERARDVWMIGLVAPMSLLGLAYGDNSADTLFDLGSRATVATGSTASVACVAGGSGVATMHSEVVLAVWLLRRVRVLNETQVGTPIVGVGR